MQEWQSWIWMISGVIRNNFNYYPFYCLQYGVNESCIKVFYLDKVKCENITPTITN